MTRFHIDHDFVPHGAKLRFCPKCLAYYIGDSHVCDPFMKKLVELNEEKKMTETQADYKTIAIEKWEERAENCPCKNKHGECRIGNRSKDYACQYSDCPFVYWLPEYR